MRLIQRIVDWERSVRTSYDTDLSTPENRRRAHIYNLWFDHAILRKVWTNFYPVAPGVYRSNQPTHERFVKLRDQGIKTILNLRGAGGAAHYLVEEESCRDLGLTLVNVNLRARQAAPRREIKALIRAFREIEKPFVMHCKSGADRAGFAAAIYLLVIERRSIPEARKMLSVKYIHFKWSRTGILDYILDRFEAAHNETGVNFERWLHTDYKAIPMQEAYEATHKPIF